MCGSKTQKTTQKTSPAPEAMNYYKQLMGRLEDVGKLQYDPYTGQRVAGFTPYQEQAMQGVAGLQGAGAGTLQQAVQAGMRGAAPITGADIQRYQDPYQQMVLDAMSAKMRQQEAEDISKLQGQSISAGAFGGDRAKLAQAQLMRNQAEERNMRMSDLMSKGYSSALAAAQADRQMAQSGAGMLQNLAGAEFAQPLAQLQALYGSGAQQQALEQQQLNVPYETYLEQRAFPYQQLQYLSGIGTGVGSQMGGKSVTTQPGPSPFSQILGGALSLGMAPMTGGASLMGNFMGNMMPSYFAPPRSYAEGGRVEKEEGGGLGQTSMFQKGFIPGIDPVKGAGAPGYVAPAGQQDNTLDNIVDKAMSLAQKMKEPINDPTNPGSWNTSISYAPENERGWTPFVRPASSGGGINVPHYDDGGGVGSSFSDALSKYLLNQYLAYKDPTGTLSRAGKTIEKAFEPLQPYARSYIEPYLSKDEEIKTEVTPRDLIGPMSEMAAQVAGRDSKDEGFKSPQIQYSPYTTSDIATIMNKNIAADQSPVATSETAELPQIEVPQGKTPSAGINQPIGEGTEGAAKGKSLLGGLLGLSPEAEQAGMAAGLAMMAGQSPFALSNIGAGGLSGVKYYNELMKAKQEEALKREEIEKKYSRSNLVKTNMVRKSDGVEVWKDKTNPEILETLDHVPVRADEIEPAKDYERRKKSEAKSSEALPAAREAYRNHNYESMNIQQGIQEIYPRLNQWGITGMGSTPLRAIAEKLGGTEAVNITKMLETLKNQLGFTALQSMKDKSKTGASGLGQLTEQEFENLKQQFGALDLGMTPDQLKSSLLKIARTLAFYRQTYADRWAEEHGKSNVPTAEELKFPTFTEEDLLSGRTTSLGGEMPSTTGSTSAPSEGPKTLSDFGSDYKVIKQ